MPYMESAGAGGRRTSCLTLLRPDLSAASAAAAAAACSPCGAVDDLLDGGGGDRRPFLLEYFFHALPLVVHPVVVLRLFCHKVFGNMLRRKTVTQAGGIRTPSPDRNSLTPPPFVESETCPVWSPPTTANTTAVAAAAESNESASGGGGATGGCRVTATTSSSAHHQSSRHHRKGPNVHVHITAPLDKLRSSVAGPASGAAAAADSIAIDEEFRLHRRRTRRAGSMDKHLLRIGSAKRRSVNAAMTLAIKSIGDSLMQPFELNVSPPAVAAMNESTADGRGGKRAFFRFPSLRKRSRSQGYIARFTDSTDSILLGAANGGSRASSNASLANVAGVCGGVGGNTKPAIDAEIKDFQRELINLPIFEVDTRHSTATAAATAAAAAAAATAHLADDDSPTMSRFSSVPDQLECLHVIGGSGGHLLDVHDGSLKKRHHHHSRQQQQQLQQHHQPQSQPRKCTSGTTAASTVVGTEKDLTQPVAVNAHSSASSTRVGGVGSGGGSSGGHKRSCPHHRHPTMEVRALSTDRDAGHGGGGGTGVSWNLPTSSSTTTMTTTTLTPLISDTIVFHFAAATPCESPISVTDQSMLNFPPSASIGSGSGSGGGDSDSRRSSSFEDVVCTKLAQLSSSSPVIAAASSSTGSVVEVSSADPQQQQPPSSPDVGTCLAIVVDTATTGGGGGPNATLSTTTEIGSPAAFRPNSLWSTPPGGRASAAGGSGGIAVSPASSSFHANLSPTPLPTTARGGTTPEVLRSPNFSLVLPSPGTDVPMHHRGVMELIEAWINVCSADLECNATTKKETKDFLNKMSSLGAEYRSWSHRVREKLRLEVIRIITHDSHVIRTPTDYRLLLVGESTYLYAKCIIMFEFVTIYM